MRKMMRRLIHNKLIWKLAGRKRSDYFVSRIAANVVGSVNFNKKFILTVGGCIFLKR